MDFRLPAEIAEGVLTHWLVDEGSSVYAGQPLAIVVTDSVEYILPAPVAGHIDTFMVEAGDDVAADAVLTQLQEQQVVRTPRLTPVARAMVAAHDLELDELIGSGSDGRIRKHDVLPLLGLAAPAGGFCVAEQIGNAPEDQVITVAAPVRSQPQARSSGMVAHQPHMALSDAPTARVALSLDALPVLTLAQQTNARLLRLGVQVDHVAIITYALAQTLAAHPELRAVWSDDGVILRAATHVGLRVGQYSHVLANAGDYSLKGLARLLTTPHMLDSVAPTCFIQFAEYALWSDARLPDGASMIVHVGALRKLPVVQPVDGLEQLVIGANYTLTLTYDTRTISDALAHHVLHHMQLLLRHG